MTAQKIPVAQIIQESQSREVEPVFRMCLQKNMELPSHYPDWAPCIQTVFDILGGDRSLREMATAIYNVWTDTALVPDIGHRLTRAQLTRVLTGLQRGGQPAFRPEDVASAVHDHYMEITITIDAATILGAHSNQGGANLVWVPNQVTMRDNHPETSTGEGTVNLDSEGLVPTMTVHWTGVSKSSEHAIDLTEFVAQSTANFERFAPMPLRVPGRLNEWLTKAHGTLPIHELAVYHFVFKIDGGTTLYAFDPYLGTKHVS